jgi:hypothetical protein
MKTCPLDLYEAEVREANKMAADMMRASPRVQAHCFTCNVLLSPEDLERSECNGCHASLLEYGSCGIRYNSKDS